MKSILQNEARCYFCGSTVGLEVHHCMFGRGQRQLSEKHGLTVYCCYRCHRDNHWGVHGNRQMDLTLKKLSQKVFEKKYGHEKWMNVFKRNYL